MRTILTLLWLVLVAVTGQGILQVLLVLVGLGLLGLWHEPEVRLSSMEDQAPGIRRRRAQRQRYQYDGGSDW